MSDVRDHPSGHYNDGNRAFLQSFMAHGTLTFEEGRKVLAAIFTIQEQRRTEPHEVTQADFDSYIAAAADAISPFDYEIRSTQHQLSKERIYALVNSVSDPLTQLATTRTTEDILYIKRLLDAMFETYNTRRREVMAVTGMQALEAKVRKPGRQSIGGEEPSTQAADKGLTSGEAEELLKKLCQEKWLDRSKAGFYRLSPRALMELRSWLVDTYNDNDDPDEWQRIKFCEACREIITIGERCADLNCNVRLHTICEQAYWNSRPSKKCPRCNTVWDGEHFVGQKAVTTTEEYLKGKRRSGGATKRSRVVEDEEEEPSSSRRAVRARRNQVQVVEDEQDGEEGEENEKDDDEEEDAEAESSQEASNEE